MSFNKISATAISYTNDKSWNVNKPKNRESLNIGTEITKYKMKLKERYKKDKKISTTQQVKEFWMDVENQSNTRYFQQDQIKSIRNKAKASPQLNKSQDNIRSNSKTVKIESLKDEEFLKSREVPLWNKNIKLGNKIVENSDTLYSLLCRRKKDFLDLMKHNLESLALPSINDKESIKKLQAKRDILQNERITYLMDRKNKDDFYVDTPIPIIHNKRYSNNSERSRCLKYTQVFLKLKQFIINDEYNDKLYVKEFLIKNGICNKELFKIEKITNIINWLKYSNMDIDPTKIFIEVITEISNYDVENENKQEAEMNNNNQINVKKRLTNKEKIKLTQEKLIEERNYQMQSMTCLAQNIISNRKKINFSNPKEVIEHLENEFRSLNLIKKSDETILTTRNLNLDKKKHDILNFQKRKKIQDEYKSDIIIQDIDQIKKKSKLLEFIILQKARNSYLLSIEAERYLEKEKLT